MRLWRAHLNGALAPIILATLGAALLGYLVPEKMQALSIPMRMAESLAPQLLVTAAVLSIGVAALGYRRLALTYLAFILAGAVWLALDYGQRTGERGEETDLTVLWLNLLFENRTPPKEIADRLAGSGADIVIVAEPLRLATVTDQLAQDFPYQRGKIDCDPECGLLVLSRRPITGGGAFDLGAHNPDGLFSFVLEPNGEDGQSEPVVITAVHLLKPWYIAFTEGEQEVLKGVLEYQTKPLLLMGDFNTAPWSRRIRTLQSAHDLMFTGPPVSTWPARAGRWGVPLDQVMQRDGVRVVSTSPWGGDIGSNHRGLFMEVDLP